MNNDAFLEQRRSKKGRYIRIGLGLAVSIALIGWLLVKVQWGEVWRELHNSNPWPLLWATLVYLLQVAFRAVRWRALLPGEDSVSLRLAFDGVMIGNLGNYILPLRGGEVLRCAVLQKESGRRFSVVLGSVAVERLCDVVSVVIFFVALTLMLPDLPQLVKQGALVFALMGVVGVLGIFFAIIAPDKILQLLSAMTVFLPSHWSDWMRGCATGLIESSAMLRSKRVVFKAFFWSMLVWITTVIFYQLLFYMFASNAPPLLGLAVAVLLALGVALPSAPGFIGIYQAACMAAFALFGFSNELGATYAIVSHLLQYVLVLGYGAWLVWRYGIKVGGG